MHIFFEDSHVGVLNDIIQDMGWFVGKWSPNTSQQVKVFESKLVHGSFKELYIRGEGIQITWAVALGDARQDAWVLGFVDQMLVLRILPSS